MQEERLDDPAFLPRLSRTVFLLAAAIIGLLGCEADDSPFPWVTDVLDAQPDTPQPDAPLPDIVSEPEADQPLPDVVQETPPDDPVEITLVDVEEDVQVEEPPPPPEYPSGPYGTGIGDRIQDLTFVTVDGTSVSFHDFFLDTTRELLLVFQTAGWCDACAYESRYLNGIYSTYWSQGLAIMAAVFEDDYGYPATREYAQEYARAYGFMFTTVVDNPSQLNAYCHEELSPMNLFIDLSTMTILDIQYGFDNYYDPMEDDIEYYLNSISR